MYNEVVMATLLPFFMKIADIPPLFVFFFILLVEILNHLHYNTSEV